ncbi:sigma-70 family RNA polymerase sigma factor [Phycisphaeraceae bacterium D3-23]
MPEPDSPADHTQRLTAAVHRYHRPLVGYARHLVGDTERARDIAQDTLLKMCLQPADVFARDLEPRLAAWLFTVCRNRAIDVLRKEQRMQSTEPAAMDRHAAPERPALSGGAGVPGAGGGASGGPSQHVEQRDSIDTLMGLVDTLPERQREVVQLRFHGQLAYRQIADVTGHSVSHVGVLLHEALKTLRREMTRLTA